MKEICVLMSTYNGENYLKEQIESVLQQDGVIVSIYIRDDGSSDETRHLLKEFKANHRNINIFAEQQNIGCVESFFRLMRLAYDKDIQYYAFCDQDDVWEKDKLVVAIEKLSKCEPDKVGMYCSNLWVTDGTLEPIRKMYSPETKPNKVSALVENIATGCTVVVNKATMEFVLNRPMPQCPIMHDWWLYKVCAFLGYVYYDETPHIKYRQHAQNVLGAKKKNNIQKTINFVNSVFKSDRSHYRRESAEEFLSTYRELLTDEDIHLIEILSEYNKSFYKRLKLVFSREIVMSNRSSNIRFKTRALFGLI